jgi:hypothetical protein
MRMYLAPCLLAVALLTLGVYFLIWSTPGLDSMKSEGAALDREVMQYFSTVAEKYASESK